MNKVGVVSLYYNNKNYGGQLQAYALIKYLSKLGYNAEQICWEINLQPTHQRNKREIKRIFQSIKSDGVKYILKKFYKIALKGKIQARECAFNNFQNSINHSEKIYNKENFTADANNYDSIVIGSDQVWNTTWYDTQYFLNFIPDEIHKISYAASMPDVSINENMKTKVKNALAGFIDISVREKITADFLSELCGRKVQHVVDPTLLLSGDEWDDISKEKLVEGKYIFCYLLGRDKNVRKQVTRFAKKMRLPIVTLPHLCGVITEDINFGDRHMYDVSPGDFVSLIKNAEYVFTDSFHAAVFSNIYKVKYLVFDRCEHKMNERIISLLEMFDAKERFIQADANLMYSMKDLPISTDDTKFIEAQYISKEFLDKNLNFRSKNENKPD